MTKFKISLPCYFEQDIKKLSNSFSDITKSIPKWRIITFYKIDFIDEFEYNHIQFTVLSSGNQKFICTQKKVEVEAMIELIING